MKRFITLENNTVVAIRFGYSIAEGEIQSDIGDLGQVMLEDGTFNTLDPIPAESQSTVEDKINYIYYKQMGVIV